MLRTLYTNLKSAGRSDRLPARCGRRRESLLLRAGLIFRINSGGLYAGETPRLEHCIAGVAASLMADLHSDRRRFNTHDVLEQFARHSLRETDQRFALLNA